MFNVIIMNTRDGVSRGLDVSDITSVSEALQHNISSWWPAHSEQQNTFWKFLFSLQFYSMCKQEWKED